MPEQTSDADETSPVVVEDASVATETGGDDDEAGIPDEIHVEFSHEVLPAGDGGDDRAAHPDGWSLDGTLAEIEGVAEAADDDDGGETPGSRTLALRLSMAVTADEEPRVSYDPALGDVRTATGIEPAAFEDLEVSPGPPRRVSRAYVPAGERDEIRIAFDGDVSSRTNDASGFTVAGGGDDGGPELAGEIAVEGDEVTLPLRTEVDREPSGDDEELAVEYGAGDDDEATMRNLVGDEGAVVEEFAEPLEFEVGDEGIEFREAQVPAGTDDDDDAGGRDTIEAWFDPPMEAETAAGYELEGTLARIEGIADGGDDDDEAGTSPHVELDLHIPIDSDEEPTLRYDPDLGDTATTGGGTPDEEISVAVETTNAAPEPTRAYLSEDGDELHVEFSKAVTSRTDDASGFTFDAGDEAGAELTGEISDGETVDLDLDGPVAIDPGADDDEAPLIEYATGGDGVNLVDAEDGVVVEDFEREIDDESEIDLAVEYARIPDDERDLVVVGFNGAVEADSAAGFELEGTYARVEGLGQPEVDDEAEERTLALSLHVEAETESATLAYDADEGTVAGPGGERVDDFEEEVESLPPAPRMEAATVTEEAPEEVRVTYDREVALHRGDATGFDLAYEHDEDEVPELTGRAETDGDEVVLRLDAALSAGYDPTLVYEGDGDEPNVLGAEDGVVAAADEVTVEVGGDEPTVELVDAAVDRDEPDRVDLRFSEAVEADAHAGFELDGTLADAEGIVEADEPGTELALALHIAVVDDEEPVVSYDADAGSVRTTTGDPLGDVAEFPVETAGSPPTASEAYIPDEARDELRVAFDGPVVSRTADASGFAVENEADDTVSLTGGVEADGDEVALELDATATVHTDVHVDYASDDDERVNLVDGDDGAVVEAFAMDADNRIDPADAPAATDAELVAATDAVEVAFDREVELEQDDAAGFELDLAESDAELSGEATVDGDTVTLFADGGVTAEAEGTVAYDGEAGNVRNADGVEADPFQQTV